MNNFHIEKIVIDGHEPYLKVWFEDIVDKNLIETWLNSQGFIKKANVKEDANCKVTAIIYLYKDSEVETVHKQLANVLQKI